MKSKLDKQTHREIEKTRKQIGEGRLYTEEEKRIVSGPSIKAVIFDLGGVVVSNDIIEYVHAGAAKHYGIGRVRLAEALKKHDAGRHRFGWDEKEYWARVAKSLRSGRPVRLFWTERYGEITRPKKDVVAIIRQLRGKFKLALLSNTCQPHIESISKKGIFNLFDVQIFSCDQKIKSVKPSAKIYKACLQALGLPSENCVFIDDFPENLVPARRLGMKTILFRDARQLKRELRKLGLV